ncbi:hypothetical protein [Methylobacterium sp. J-077]|nr:hypothetical protein [Methylobacterium sp. J-077]
MRHPIVAAAVAVLLLGARRFRRTAARRPPNAFIGVTGGAR